MAHSLAVTREGSKFIKCKPFSEVTLDAATYDWPQLNVLLPISMTALLKL